MFWIGLIVGSILGVVFVGILAANAFNEYKVSLKSKDSEIQHWVTQYELHRKWAHELSEENSDLKKKIDKNKVPYKIKAGNIPRGIISESAVGT